MTQLLLFYTVEDSDGNTKFLYRGDRWETIWVKNIGKYPSILYIENMVAVKKVAGGLIVVTESGK